MSCAEQGILDPAFRLDRCQLFRPREQRHTVKEVFSNTGSAIAQKLESEIDRATHLWLDALQPLGRNPDKEADSPFYNRLGVGELSFGMGVQKLQKAFFHDTKRVCFRLITRRS